MALPESVQLPRPGVEDERAATRRREARSHRFALRCALWKLTSLKSVRGCARNVAAPAAGGSGSATLLLGADGRAGWSGVTRCSSLWACPPCSERIRSQRAQDVEAAGVEHLRRGGGLAFLTLTMPHDAADPLAETLHVVMAGWRKLLQSTWMREWRARHGGAFIRAVEVTHTRPEDGGSGWHPHVHVLVFTDAPMGADSRADFLARVDSSWSRHVTGTARARGGNYRAPAGGGVGVNLRDVEGGVDHATQLLAYLAKVQDGYGGSWYVGAELVKGHHKRGRRALSRTPFELAESAAGLTRAEDGQLLPFDPADLLLWHEYEAATAGRKALHWSEGLRARLLTADEVLDDEVAEVEPPALVVAALDPVEYRTLCQLRNRHLLARLCELAERREYAHVDQLLDDALGRSVVVELAAPPDGRASGGRLDPRAALAAYRRGAP